MSKMIFNGLEFVNGVQINELYPICYDTDEREVGCWVDGKPLYQRSISIANTSISRNGTVIIYTQTNIDLKYSSGYLIESNLIYILPEIGIRIMQSGDDIEMSATGNAMWDITDGYVTIQYTKTTDVAGSGTWNSQGQYAHHYSEDEKVVGTWIDGKPLYERVFTGLSISGGGWKDTGIDSSPMDIIPFGRAIDNANQSYDITIGKSNNHVYIRYTTDGQDIIKLILQYTKTTD